MGAGRMLGDQAQARSLHLGQQLSEIRWANGHEKTKSITQGTAYAKALRLEGPWPISESLRT